MRGGGGGKKLIFVSPPFAIGGANHLERSEGQFSWVVVAFRKKVGPSRGKSVSVLAGDYTHNNGMCLKM